MQQVEVSLQRLGTDHLDMYLMHEPDPSTPLEETLRALDDLIHQGKVLYIGASQMPAWLMSKSLWISDKYNLHRFEWVQNSYSLLDRDDEKEIFPLCDDQDLGYTPFSPLSGGLLTGKYRFEQDLPGGSRMTMRPEPYLKYWNQETFDALELLRAEADYRGVSMAGLSLAWVMNSPHVTAPIFGPRRAEHFEPVRQALSLELSAEDHAHIRGLFTGEFS
jgi:aryl-alcohol dehydrogenase-like predicted oxidoreductase